MLKCVLATRHLYAFGFFAAKMAVQYPGCLAALVSVKQKGNSKLISPILNIALLEIITFLLKNGQINGGFCKKTGAFGK